MPATKEQCRLYRQRLRDRAFNAIGRKCVFCQSGDDLHASHVMVTKINGMGRGLDRRYRDVIANPEAYRPMCRECHRIFDALVGLIKLNEVPF